MSELSERTLCFLVRGSPPKEVLLGLKKRGFGVGKFAGFGGAVEEGETIRGAAARELDEETGLKVKEQDLEYMGHVVFLFSAKPAWDQKVYVFRATAWAGVPAESDEMQPAWFGIDELPLRQMWQDAAHWLPQVLDGQRLYKRFVLAPDNETVETISEDETQSDI